MQGRTPICQVCGAQLVRQVAPSVERAPQTDLDALADLFELLGADIRHAIQEAMADRMPTRHISVDYLSTLGKVVVDERRTILRDLSISMGPFAALAVSAQFGPLPEENLTVSAKLVCGQPACGEAELSNSSECNGAITLLERGLVSFASKSLRAIAAGSVAVVISQTAGVWPFLMSDSIGEIAACGKAVTVPVVMISQKDAEIVKKLMREQPHLASSAALKIGHSVNECSICQESIDVGHTVYKLPCRHVYHVDCVTQWLQQNHTCPLCRLELPKETEGKRLRRREDEQSRAPIDPSRMYFN